MPTIVFVCEGNIFRSQIAEGFFNAHAPREWHATSAGISPRRDHIHPGAVALMAEIGIDISGQRPKPVDPALLLRAWRVFAICDAGLLPIEARDRVEHWPIIDPAHLPEERWREIRDEIARRVTLLLGQIREQP